MRRRQVEILLGAVLNHIITWYYVSRFTVLVRVDTAIQGTRSALDGDLHIIADFICVYQVKALMGKELD
jgi:hypothetical protein